LLLVTGAFGFIGSHLVERLLDDGEEVLAVGVAPPAEDNLKHLTAHRNAHLMRVAVLDLTDLNSFKRLLRSFQPSTIYHLAALASHRLSHRDPHPYLHNNLNTVLTVLEAARTTEPTPKIVFTSSSSVYGDNQPPLREDMTPRPRGPYALSKLMGEQLCRLYSEEYGLQCPIIRYFNVVGERCRGNIVFKIFADRIARGEPVEVNGRYVDGVFKPAERDFTYVRDAVEGTILVGVKGVSSEIYNIGFGRPVSVARVAELLMADMGRRVKVVEKELQLHETLVSYSDNRKARENLGWQPKTDLEEMVKRYAEWYRSIHPL
jgi:nucleoside-diphosphate-sugar epimerase